MLWLVAVEVVAGDVVRLGFDLFASLCFRLDGNRLTQLLRLSVLFQDVEVEDDEDVLVLDEVALELLEPADAAFLQLVLVDDEVEFFTTVRQLADYSFAWRCVHTLSQHALHEVDAIAHDHTVSLCAILAGHRLDLHTLYDRLLFSKRRLGDLA